MSTGWGGSARDCRRQPITPSQQRTGRGGQDPAVAGHLISHLLFPHVSGWARVVRPAEVAPGKVDTCWWPCSSAVTVDRQLVDDDRAIDHLQVSRVEVPEAGSHLITPGCNRSSGRTGSGQIHRAVVRGGATAQLAPWWVRSTAYAADRGRNGRLCARAGASPICRPRGDGGLTQQGREEEREDARVQEGVLPVAGRDGVDRVRDEPDGQPDEQRYSHRWDDS